MHGHLTYDLHDKFGYHTLEKINFQISKQTQKNEIKK